MRILLISSAYNGLTQRAHLELSALGHEVSVELSLSPDIIREGVQLFRPNLIICPFLKEKIPDGVWQRYTCIIIHPGIKGDRGPSAMDWAMMDGVEEWGVTALQATALMDAGAIWSAVTFKRRPVSKARMYRHEITEAAMTVMLETVKRFESEIYLPEALDYTSEDVKGKLRPPMTQKDRSINWLQDDVNTIIRKIYSADNQPGVLNTLYEEDYYLYGVHREGKLLGDPGEIIAKREDAICIAAIDGAVWISHLRKKSTQTQQFFKLPATFVLGDKLAQVPESPIDVFSTDHCHPVYTDKNRTYSEIWYHEKNGVGFLTFDFYNGAMDTEKCERLKTAYLRACERQTRVLVLLCGMDFWSNGIHLNRIEAADHPADEAWRNINAINDLIQVIITTTSHLVISAMLGNAAAGGLTMALAADFVYARSGIILNPHYKTMGLYGSEYWTYLLPRRIGPALALELTEQCMPISTQQAKLMGLIDGIIYSDGYDFYRHIVRLAESLAGCSDYHKRIREKQRQLEKDEAQKSLSRYREEELTEMKKCFYDPQHIYPQACGNFHLMRKNFVYKIRPTITPARLARHRPFQSCSLS